MIDHPYQILAIKTWPGTGAEKRRGKETQSRVKSSEVDGSFYLKAFFVSPTASGGDSAGSILDLCNQGNSEIKCVTRISGFSVHMKVMFILFCCD